MYALDPTYRYRIHTRCADKIETDASTEANVRHSRTTVAFVRITAVIWLEQYWKFSLNFTWRLEKMLLKLMLFKHVYNSKCSFRAQIFAATTHTRIEGERESASAKRSVQTDTLIKTTPTSATTIMLIEVCPTKDLSPLSYGYELIIRSISAHTSAWKIIHGLKTRLKHAYQLKIKFVRNFKCRFENPTITLNLS